MTHRPRRLGLGGLAATLLLSLGLAALPQPAGRRRDHRLPDGALHRGVRQRRADLPRRQHGRPALDRPQRRRAGPALHRRHARGARPRARPLPRRRPVLDHRHRPAHRLRHVVERRPATTAAATSWCGSRPTWSTGPRRGCSTSPAASPAAATPGRPRRSGTRPPTTTSCTGRRTRPLNGVDEAPHLLRPHHRLPHHHHRRSSTSTAPGTQGIIDTQIIEVPAGVGGYRYYRASGDGQITIEGSNSILGTWTNLGNLSGIGTAPARRSKARCGRSSTTATSGPSGSTSTPPAAATCRSPRPTRPATGTYRTRRSDYGLGGTTKRHGSILNLTAAEESRVLARWANAAGQPAPVVQLPGPVRAARQLRRAHRPERQPGRRTPSSGSCPAWPTASGTVSFESVNFPGYYLRHDDSTSAGPQRRHRASSPPTPPSARSPGSPTPPGRRSSPTTTPTATSATTATCCGSTRSPPRRDAPTPPSASSPADSQACPGQLCPGHAPFPRARPRDNLPSQPQGDLPRTRRLPGRVPADRGRRRTGAGRGDPDRRAVAASRSTSPAATSGTATTSAASPRSRASSPRRPSRTPPSPSPPAWPAASAACRSRRPTACGCVTATTGCGWRPTPAAPRSWPTRPSACATARPPGRCAWSRPTSPAGYLRHRNIELWIDPSTTNPGTFAADSSFRVTTPWAAGPPQPGHQGPVRRPEHRLPQRPLLHLPDHRRLRGLERHPVQGVLLHRPGQLDRPRRDPRPRPGRLLGGQPRLGADDRRPRTAGTTSTSAPTRNIGVAAPTRPTGPFTDAARAAAGRRRLPQRPDDRPGRLHRRRRPVLPLLGQRPRVRGPAQRRHGLLRRREGAHVQPPSYSEGRSCSSATASTTSCRSNDTRAENYHVDVRHRHLAVRPVDPPRHDPGEGPGLGIKGPGHHSVVQAPGTRHLVHRLPPVRRSRPATAPTARRPSTSWGSTPTAPSSPSCRPSDAAGRGRWRPPPAPPSRCGGAPIAGHLTRPRPSDDWRTTSSGATSTRCEGRRSPSSSRDTISSTATRPTWFFGGRTAVSDGSARWATSSS